jgi:electron transport complex protein RnfE
MGVGFTIVLCILAAIREVLAAGTIFEIRVMPNGFVPWAAMSLPVGAFITLGLMLGFVNLLTAKKS